MIVKELSDSIFYIENAFEHAKEFVAKIEELDEDPSTYDVIPKWKDWYDSQPYQDEFGQWKETLKEKPTGKQKEFNWNRSLTNFNSIWPIPEFELDDTRKLLEPVINLIHEPYLKILDIWYEKTGNKKLDYVSKNYMLKKYNTGGSIGTHIDINPEDPQNTMDWSALFYLNDDYVGGEIEFTDLDITLKPAAGSALIFPTTAPHMAFEVTEGNKYFIFMMIDTGYSHSLALYEEYPSLNGAIRNYREANKDIYGV